MHFKLNIFLLFLLTNYLKLESAQIPDAQAHIKSLEQTIRKLWFDAAENGYLEIIKSLIDKVDINTKDRYDSPALLRAAFKGYENVVQFLLSTPGIDVNAQCTVGNTPLIMAACGGNENVVKLLLKVPGIDVNIQDVEDEDTALITAVNGNHENIVKLLLQVPGINVNPKKYGKTALIWAAGKGHENIVKLLLESPEIAINAQDEDGNTAYAVCYEKHPAIARLIKNKIEELTQKAFRAVAQNDLNALKIIVTQIGIDNVFDSKGKTLLEQACNNKCPEIIKFLLQHTENPRTLLSKLTFKSVEINSHLVQYVLDLAFKTDQETGSKKRKRTESESDDELEHARKSTREDSSADSLETDKKLCAHCSKADCHRRCAACKTAYYCSDECQKTHWRIHKFDCKPISESC